MNIQPLADRIVLEQVQQEEKTKSGIILPDGAQEKPKMAKVLGAIRQNNTTLGFFFLLDLL